MKIVLKRDEQFASGTLMRAHENGVPLYRHDKDGSHVRTVAIDESFLVIGPSRRSSTIMYITLYDVVAHDGCFFVWSSDLRRSAVIITDPDDIIYPQPSA